MPERNVFTKWHEMNLSINLNILAGRWDKHGRIVGLLIFDNVLWSGRVLEGEDDGRPATRGVKDFTARLFAHRGFVPFVNPTRDGVAVALRV